MRRPHIWVSLTWEQKETLKRAAKLRGVSVAELVRSSSVADAEAEIDSWRNGGRDER